MKLDVIIVGGGAAGLMCAIEAGKRGRRVALLEHNDAIGKKIKISDVPTWGNGICSNGSSIQWLIASITISEWKMEIRELLLAVSPDNNSRISILHSPFWYDPITR